MLLMDPKTTQNSNGNNEKTECKHEEKKKMKENGNHKDATDKTVEEVCRQMSKLVDDGSRGGNAGSGSSSESEDLVNAINYNTITSLAALKDILQGDGSDTPETDSFFQHYFMNHCNNLSSRNSVTGSPFSFPERRRLSQCMEEDEDDERKEIDPPPSMVFSENASDDSFNVKEAETSEAGEVLQTEPCEASGSKRTVMGARHKFLVTTAKPPASPIERVLRSQVHNSHTVHFGTKGAEEQRPSVRSIFAGQNLHRDKHYFDSSLVEIRSIVDDTTTSSEDIWVKRADVKPARKSSIEAEKDKLKAEAEILDQATAVRPRAGTWSSQTAKRELDFAKKAKKDKESAKKDSGDRRQKRDHRLDVAITRSTQSVGERRRRGSADEGQAHQMYQQTIHGTSGVSRRPALFDIFKSKQRGDPKSKQPSIMQQVKAAVQNMTKSGTPVKDPSKGDSKPLDAESVTSPVPDKARDGSAHPHPGSDTRYYHTVTASATRRPSAMAKVMDIFRGKPFSPGQTIHSEGGERRKARAIAQLQHQYASGAHLRRAASQEAEKRRSSLGNVPQMRHRASDAFLDPHHAAMLFRDSRGLPVADPFLEKVSLSDLGANSQSPRKTEENRFWAKNRRLIPSQNFCENYTSNTTVPDVGVNVDRNWFFEPRQKKEPECSPVRMGDTPLSEEETRSAADMLSFLGPKLMAFINLRGYASMVTVPYAFTRDYCTNYPVLMEILESVHTILHEKFNVTYDIGNSGSLLYNISGNVADWVKKELNVPLVYTVYMKHNDEILQRVSHVQPLSDQFILFLEELLIAAQDIYGPLFDCSRKNEVELAILVPLGFLFSIVIQI